MNGFQDIVGHEKTIAHLRSAIALNRVSHAYLLTGDTGIGKKTIARAFAQALLCEDKKAVASGNACGKCASCIQAMSGNHPDIITWTHEKPKTFSVDDVRDLAADVAIRPFTGSRKVYLIPDAQLMNAQAQNALLKTLEEPPEYAVMILMATSADAMLDTVRSRCTTLDLKPVPGSQLHEYLIEKAGVSIHEADVCEAFAQGNIGRALSLASSEEFGEVLETAIHILSNIRQWELSEIVHAVKELVPHKLTIDDLLDLFTVWYRDVLFFKATRDADGIVFTDHLVAIRKAASESSYEGIEAIIRAIERAKERLHANVSFELAMELLLLTMREN